MPAPCPRLLFVPLGAPLSFPPLPPAPSGISLPTFPSPSKNRPSLNGGSPAPEPPRLPTVAAPHRVVRRPRLGGIRNLPPPAGAEATAFRSPSLFHYSMRSLALRPTGAWRNWAATRGGPRPRSVPSGGGPRPRFSSSPPLSGQSGVPPTGRGFLNRLTLQGLIIGLGATLPRSVGWGRPSLWSCRPQALGSRWSLVAADDTPAVRPLSSPPPAASSLRSSAPAF